MNSLSWMLYFSDILENISNLLSGIAFCGAIYCGAIIFLLIISKFDKQIFFHCKKYVLKITLPLVILLLVFTSLIPGKQTFYLIIASQMGEKISQDSSTKEILGSLKETVLTELAKMRKVDSSK